MKTVLITGVSGFVGTALARKLSAFFQVRGTSSQKKQGLIRIDLAKQKKVDLKNIDVVVHVATALPEMFKSQPGKGYRINVGGTKMLLKASKKAHVKKFIYISTGGVFQRSNFPITENTVRSPVDKYAESKDAAEKEVLKYQRHFKVSIAYLFFPYGPGQSPQRLVPRLIKKVQEQQPIATNEDGGPRLSVTYIEDVAEALKRLCLLRNPPLRILIAGSAVQIKEIANSAGELLGKKPVFSKNVKPNLDMVADITSMRKLLVFTPKTSLREGLQKVLG